MPHWYSTAKRVWHSIQGVLPQTTGPLSAAAAARVGSASQNALRKTRGHCRLISGVQGSHARAPSPAAQRTTKLSPNVTRRAFVCARRQSSIVAARRAARRIKYLCGGNAPQANATWTLRRGPSRTVQPSYPTKQYSQASAGGRATACKGSVPESSTARMVGNALALTLTLTLTLTLPNPNSNQATGTTVSSAIAVMLACKMRSCGRHARLNPRRHT